MTFSKDILLDLARRCFWQLGYEVNFLWRLEVRQMITSVIAQLGFRRGRGYFLRRQMRGAPRPSVSRAFLRLPPPERLDVAARRLRLPPTGCWQSTMVHRRTARFHHQLRH